MDISAYRFDGEERFCLNSVKPGATTGLSGKKEGLRQLEKNKEQMAAQQAALFAEDRQALLVVFQAMDAAGKDGTIKKVFSGINPQGISVANFKSPSSEELAHDYLWRIHKQVPPRGRIGVFNRSHYEDVLIGRVMDLPAKQQLPARSLKGIWKKRYRHIQEFEEYLDDNGVKVLKFFLYLSPEEQRERFLARLDDPGKNWKFEGGDLDTRAAWPAYMKAYQEAINATATKRAPWYVVPADHKWYTHAVVSEVVARTLKAMRPRVPVATADQEHQLAGYRASLLAETTDAPAETPVTPH